MAEASLRLSGKIAIVTGGASGIGEANEGVRMVVIADIQDELGNQLVASIGLQRCTYIHCDVSYEDQVKILIQSTVSTYGQIDIMLSNAGITSLADHTVLELDASVLDRLLAVKCETCSACNGGRAL